MTNTQAVNIATIAALDAILSRCGGKATIDLEDIQNDLGQLAVIVRRLVKEAK